MILGPKLPADIAGASNPMGRRRRPRCAISRIGGRFPAAWHRRCRNGELDRARTGRESRSRAPDPFRTAALRGTARFAPRAPSHEHLYRSPFSRGSACSRSGAVAASGHFPTRCPEVSRPIPGCAHCPDSGRRSAPRSRSLFRRHRWRSYYDPPAHRNGIAGGRKNAAGYRLLYLPLLVPEISFVFGLQVLMLSAGLTPALRACWASISFSWLPYVLLSLSAPWRAVDRASKKSPPVSASRRWKSCSRSGCHCSFVPASPRSRSVLPCRSASICRRSSSGPGG